MSKEEILAYFYATATFIARQEGLEGAVRPERATAARS